MLKTAESNGEYSGGFLVSKNDKVIYKGAVGYANREGGIGGFSSLNIISEQKKLSIIFLGNIGTDTLFRTYAKQGLSYQILATMSE